MERGTRRAWFNEDGGPNPLAPLPQGKGERTPRGPWKAQLRRSGLSVVLERGEDALFHGEALGVGGERAGAHLGQVAPDGLGDGGAEVGVDLGVPGRERAGGFEVEEVVQHLDLAVAARPGADADGRDLERLGDAL